MACEQAKGHDPREPGSQETLSKLIAGLLESSQVLRSGTCAWVDGRVFDGQETCSNDTADTDNGSNDVAIGVAPRDIGQLTDGAALLLPAVTEAEVEEENQDPGLENDVRHILRHRTVTWNTGN